MYNYITEMMKVHNWHSNYTFLIAVLFYFSYILSSSVPQVFISIQYYIRKSDLYNILKMLIYVINFVVNKLDLISICFCLLILTIILNRVVNNNILQYDFKSNKINIPSGIVLSCNLKSILLNIINVVYLITVEFFRSWFIINLIFKPYDIFLCNNFNGVVLFLLFILNIISALLYTFRRLTFHLSQHAMAGYSVDLLYIIKNCIVMRSRILHLRDKHKVTLLLLKPKTLYVTPNSKNKYCFFVIKSQPLNQNESIHQINLNISRDVFNIKNDYQSIYDDKHVIKHIFDREWIKQNKRRLGNLRTWLNNEKHYLSHFKYKLVFKSYSFDACDYYFKKYIRKMPWDS